MNMKKIWRMIILLLAISVMPFTATMAQDIEFPELKGFNIDKSYPVYTPDNLWDYINGGADSYNALGFSDLHIADYEKGKNSIKLEIYNHASENLAFGIYAMERAPSYDFFDLGVQGYKEKGLIHFLKGEYYVKLTTYSDKKRILSAMDELAQKTEVMLDGSDEFPASLDLFPEKGKQQYSEMYIADNVMGHEFLEDAFRADYKLDDKRFTIYLFTEKTDDENREMLDQYLSRYELSPGESPGGKFSFKDGYNGYVYIEWSKGIVALISGLKEDDAELANEYFNSISD
ncbi:MAG: DUF6599 family protein [Bacteroidales bacterium]|nr:DUF6599 family protein [Bacteroidales bacterium]